LLKTKEKIMQQRIDDVRVKEFTPLVSPRALKQEFPITEKSRETVVTSREIISSILERKDRRMLAIMGPCSIHDEKAALEYAERVRDLSGKVSDTLCLVMRVYFEKPRTTVGWKGLINDPWLDGSNDIVSGLRKARSLLLSITGMGVPTATEMLDPITPQYIADLVSWSAIGARTTESQTHREMASGLSMPVGFKNCTDGGLDTAINAIIASSAPQSFLGIDSDGQTCIVQTSGNPHTHLVLRGGARPNYDSVSVMEALELLKKKNLPEIIMIDCSHGNSRKNHRFQSVVWQDAINQRMDGNSAIVGLMLESNLHEGNQKNTCQLSTMEYGVSITDACISWEATERLILSAHEHLSGLAAASEGEGMPRMERYQIGQAS
jgi:3-deoxy-7-phosphoheptulonate synthase